MLKPVSAVEINGPVGIEVDKFRQDGSLLVPSQLRLRLPDGRRLGVETRSLTYLKYGAGSEDVGITDVYFRRPLQPSCFQAVLADLRETLKMLDIPESADIEAMSTWGDIPGIGDQGGLQPYAHRVGSLRLDSQTSLLIELKPDPDKGWYYLMMIGVDLESRSRVASKVP
jgi:hypothetical protein